MLFCSANKDVTDSPSEIRRIVSANRNATDNWRILVQPLALSLSGIVLQIATSSSAEDLMRQTPEFWSVYVQRKLNRDFAGLYQFLNAPYPHGPNEYLERIEANMAKLRQRLAGAKHGQ